MPPKRRRGEAMRKRKSHTPMRLKKLAFSGGPAMGGRGGCGG